MKKLNLFLVLFSLLPALAFGQINNDNFASGITHKIADLYLSAADSMHYMGTYRLVDGNGAMYDSLGLNLFANDSLIACVYGVIRSPLTAAISPTVSTVTADTLKLNSINGSGWSTTVSTNTTVSGVYYQWPAFVAATLNRPAASIDIWVRVYAVGSEVASSSKSFTVQIIGHKIKR